MTKALKNTIARQLEQLERKMEEIRSFFIDLDEENWDADHYYDLAEKLKETLNLLEEEEGLLENLDSWQEQQEENKDF